MTVDLQRELAELAEGARSYADLPGVLDRARRIRRRRRLVPAAAAVALAAVAALVWATVPVPGDPPPASGRPFPELPRRVEAPAEPPPPLPSDRAVGEAALAYQCRGCPVHLMLADGTRYRLDDGYTDRDGGRQVALSPDGRWLGLEVAEGFLVRDLTSTAQETYDGFLGTAWSPDSRWLLGRGGVVDVTTGELTPVKGDQSGQLGLSAQVLDSGELAIVDDLATADGRLVVRIVDPASGRLRRQLEIDTRPLLRPGERTTIPDPVVDASQATLTIGDRGVGLVYIWSAEQPAEPAEPPAPRQVVGVMLVSLDDGSLLGRVDAPRSAAFWAASRFAGGLVLALHVPADRGAWELLAHDPGTGTVHLVSRVTVDGFVLRQTEAGWLKDPGDLEE